MVFKSDMGLLVRLTSVNNGKPIVDLVAMSLRDRFDLITTSPCSTLVLFLDYKTMGSPSEGCLSLIFSLWIFQATGHIFQSSKFRLEDALPLATHIKLWKGRLLFQLQSPGPSASIWLSR